MATQITGTVKYTLSTGARGPEGLAGATGPPLNLTAGPVRTTAGTSSIAAEQITPTMLATGIPVAKITGLVATATSTDAANLTGTLAPARIADGALSIAKTSGLETALDGKAARTPIVPTPLSIADDRGGQTITHTSPLYIPEGFGGYKYWMAYTPYPGAAEENPRVMASHDGVAWVLPDGMSALIDTEAGAQALGHIGWSDTELAWDGTKIWLIYRGYGNGTTYTTNETIYLRQCTDGINWSARSAILSGASSTAAALLSPSLIREDDGTWKMYVIDNGAGNFNIYTSATGLTGWAYSAAATFPTGASKWHMAVRKYGGVYYALVNSRRAWALFAYHSTDGINFYGRGIPFVPNTGTALDAGGYYRSGFHVSGGLPAVLNIYAVPMTGSTETINNAEKTHRCYLYQKPYEGLNAPASAWDDDVIQMVDYFIAGQDVSASEATIGDLRWSLYNGVGSGSAAPGGANKATVYDTAMPGFSAVAIKSGATAGNITGLQFDHDTAAGGGRFPWRYDQITSLQNLTIKVSLRVESLADSIWIGIGSANLAASPARFVGLQLTPASANWRFVSRESGGSSFDVDSLKPATAGAGNWWRFEMRWARTKWQMRIVDVDGYPSSDNQNDGWLDVTNAITASNGVNFTMATMAGGAAASELRVCKWALRAFTGRY